MLRKVGRGRFEAASMMYSRIVPYTDTWNLPDSPEVRFCDIPVC